MQIISIVYTDSVLDRESDRKRHSINNQSISLSETSQCRADVEPSRRDNINKSTKHWW